jgi:anti-sigma factor ChrR (cupin superfamily)
MSSHDQDHLDRVCLHALGALPAADVAAVEAQLAACADCRQELARLGSLADALVAWPTDVLRPPVSLWTRLAERIAGETGQAPLPPAPTPPAPDWSEVAPGIACKVLAADPASGRVSLLVRLAPGTAYPPHRHAGLEELHLLDGELWIGDRKLLPGDYDLGEAGAEDHHVWSETGCTCVLITSSRDVLL